MHIFADTYAHEWFNGFWNRSINNFKVTRALRHDAGGDVDVTDKYTRFSSFPALGHTTVDTAPDDSNLSFRMELETIDEAKQKRVVVRERDNTAFFRDAAVQIYRYLYRCAHAHAPDAAEEQGFATRVTRGLLLNNHDERALEGLWGGVFPGYSYGYSKQEMMGKLFPGADRAGVLDALMQPPSAHETEESADTVAVEEISREFYWFTLYAAELRQEVQEEQ